MSDLHDRMDFQHYSAPYAVEVRGGVRGKEGKRREKIGGIGEEEKEGRGRKGKDIGKGERRREGDRSGKKRKGNKGSGRGRTGVGGEGGGRGRVSQGIHNIFLHRSNFPPIYVTPIIHVPATSLFHVFYNALLS